MTPRPSTIRELCAEAGCTTPETDVMALLAVGHSINEVAALQLVSPSKTWALRRAAKRRIREHFGINPDDAEWAEGVEVRRAAARDLHMRGHSSRYIGERLGISHTSVSRLVESLPKNTNRDLVIHHPGACLDAMDDEAARAFQRTSSPSKTSPISYDHWPSSTGIDPFLEPGTPGGPPIHPVTTRRVDDE